MTTVAAVPSRRALTGKLVMSFFGIVPLGVYVFAHLWTNLNSLAGPEAFDAALLRSRSHPTFLFLEIVGLGAPLLVHTVLGLGLLGKMRPNNARYRSLRNLKFLLQRISAIGILLFIGAHVVKARIAPAMAGRVETWEGMHEALSEPITFGVYVLGLLGVSYHLANGLWTAGLTLGLTVSPRAQRISQGFSAVVFVLLLAMSALAVAGFRPFQAL